MTCIIGMVTKDNNVIIGGDSAAIADSDITVRKDEKVFKVNQFVFGCSSSYRMMQLLRYSFKPPPINGREIYKYMCTDFINAVRECFKEGGYLQKNTDGEEKGGAFLVGYEGRLFKVEPDFQVGEALNGVDACGCGESYALGAIMALDGIDINPTDKILKSLEVAELLSIAVRKPFVLINT